MGCSTPSALFKKKYIVMKHNITLLAMALATITQASAQKKLYIPVEWQNRTDTLIYKESDPDNKYTWSKSRSKESENFIVYWDKNYGKTIPTNSPSAYRVDIDDLLQKAESFYALNVGKLAFCDEKNSNVSRYKMMILLNHTTEWVCYGGGYDDLIGALWLSPSTCAPVGQSVAHEVGHSFQYQCYADLRGHAGFRAAIGQGSTFWEQTAQWQSVQAYPEHKWSQSWPLYSSYSNCAMTHEWMRYQSYWWHYFLAEKYGIDFIGKLWRHDTGKGDDPNQVLMDLLDIDANELYRLYFEYALKMATIDLQVAQNENGPYIGTYPYRYYPVGDNTYQVAYYSCPQSTGFNVIPLNVPAAGQTITTIFTSLKSKAHLAPDDNAAYLENGVETAMPGKTTYNENKSYSRQRAFRIGYVALLHDGTRKYIYEDKLYCSEGGLGNKTEQISATIPGDIDKLYLVVSPAPKEYIQHLWDSDFSNDDQWPYTVSFQGTNIYGAPIISDDLPISDAVITYDVSLPYSSSSYAFTPVQVEGLAASVLGTAFQMPAQQLANHMVAWTSAQPTDGEAKFYPVNRITGNPVNKASTANGYGHWFNVKGTCSDFGTGAVYSEFNPSNLTFNVGQKPGSLTPGTTYTISQAVKYAKGEAIVTVRFVFRVTCTSSNSEPSTKLVDVKQDEVVTGIGSASVSVEDKRTSTTHISGMITPAGMAPGVSIIHQTDGMNIKVINQR